MVQDFTTSFVQFETFALSQMAKQPELIEDPSTPFIPKFWTNRESTNSMNKSESSTSFYETKFESNLEEFYLSPRRSGRIANQSKINYNENIPKLFDKQKNNKRHKKSIFSSKEKLSNTYRTRAIRKLFKKPTDSADVSKPKSHTKNESNGNAGQISTVPNSLKISIPLIHTKLLTATSAITKASLKLFEDGLAVRKTNHRNSGGREFVPDNFRHWSLKKSKKRKQIDLKNVSEVENVPGKDFAGIFKSSNDDEEVVFVNSWKQTDPIKQNYISRSFGVKRSAFIQASKQLAKSSTNNGFIENKSKKRKIVVDIIESSGERDQHSVDRMEISNEVEKQKVLEFGNEGMEISNESNQFSEEIRLKHAQHCKEDEKVLMTSSKPEQSITSFTSVSRVSVEKEFPLDLSIMDVSEEFWKTKKLGNRNHSTLAEYEFSENSTIMEVSSELSFSTTKKISSNKDDTCKPVERLSMFNSLKNNCEIEKAPIPKRLCTEKLETIQTFSKNKITRTRSSSLGYAECTQLSENLSSMKISHTTQKPTYINSKVLEKNDEPFDLTISELSEDFQNLTRTKDPQTDTPNPTSPGNIETFRENDDNDVMFLETNKSSEYHQSQTSNSTINDVLDENKNDLRKNERKIIEQLESLIEKCPRDGSENLNEDNSVEITNDFENRSETVVLGEVEISLQNSDIGSEVEVIEEGSNMNSSEHLDEDRKEEK
ncbi:uncharacterized protein LOC129951845 [Eupeodes corollae]|uniref:uncharacterized protein LOC129951845 n=1 Tax=Eupeodes corollae TaxID=290404 RepID=UPI0024935D07|nr:uncharacterized protein LOC129951845 [Eupeodes corollae]